MLYNAQNKHLNLNGVECDYIHFGSGSKPMVLLPGLGDGLQTAKGMALPFAVMFRALAKQYDVYVFSRRINPPPGFTTADMAADVAAALRRLGVENASVVGISQGGMIAQHLAAAAPELVGHLVLGVTTPCANPMLCEAVQRWKAMARAGDYKTLMLDIARQSYSRDFLRKNFWLYKIVASFGGPKSYDRFLVLADACATHDATAVLHRITCPTLVLGAMEDCTLGVQGSLELHRQIPGSELHLYPGMGHGVYEESPDFWPRVMSFCQ